MEGFRLSRLTLVLLVTALFLGACSSGGGGGGSTQAQNAPDSGPAPRSYIEPGDYATVSDCLPFQGSEVGELKIMFVNLDNAPYFDAITDATVEEFRTLAPWSEFFQNMAFYKVNLSGAENYNCANDGGPLAGSGLSCDNDKIDNDLAAKCGIDDVSGLMKVVIAESDYGNSAGEVVYIASKPSWASEQEALDETEYEILHEVSHDLGLADLSGEAYRKDGSPMTGWPSDVSREFLNLDGPGCSKWCDSYKPASEYVISESAQCPHFSDRSSCLGFHRSPEGDCEDADGDGHFDCCAWSEESSDDYFGGQCTPVWGSKDIGLSCLDGAGCYYGGAHGNNSWRPVRDPGDSIMYSHLAGEFDSVSERGIRDVMRCCASGEDGSSGCSDFRTDYADFLEDSMVYKQRIGSCGVVQQP